MTKHKILILGLLLAVTGAHAQDTMRISLDSVLRYAFAHNLQVQSAMLNQEASEVSLMGARLRFLPTVSASASQGWNSGSPSSSTTQYGINGNLTLFSGLNNLYNLRQSKIGREQGELRVRQAENTVAVQLVQAYLTILMNEERLSYQQQVLETSRQQQLEGEVKYRVGRILQSDYLLLEANYSSAQAEIENTRLTIEENRSTLRKLMGYEGAAALDVLPSQDTTHATHRQLIPFDTLLVQARQALPDWQLSELSVESARMGVGMARSAFLPTLSVGAGYGGQRMNVSGSGSGADFANSGSLTLGLNIPIFSQGVACTQYKQSKIALRQAELEHRQAEIDLEDELEQAYFAAGQALSRYRATEALVEAYRASYDVYVLKYGQGTVTTVEMLQQQDKYLSALNDYLQNKYSFLLTEKQIDIYTGREVKL